MTPFDPRLLDRLTDPADARRFALGLIGLVALFIAVLVLFALPWHVEPGPYLPAGDGLPGSAVRQSQCPAPHAGEHVAIHIRVVAGELVATCTTHRRPY